MVARLPQQVLLLLVLVTKTTTGTAHRPELSDWATSSSTRQVGASSTRFSHPTSLEGYRASSESSGHGSRAMSMTDGFSDASIDVGITVTADLTTSANFRLGPVLTISDGKSLSYKIERVQPRYQIIDWNQKLRGANAGSVQLKKPKNWRASEERAATWFFTSPSVNTNQFKPTLSSKESSELHDKKEKWRLSSSPIIGAAVGYSTLLSHQRIARYISLSSSAFPLSTHETLFTNDKPMTDHSRQVETIVRVDFNEPKINQGTSNSNRINIQGTTNLRLKQRFPKFGGTIFNKKTNKFGDAKRELPAKGHATVFVESPVIKPLEMEDRNTDVSVDTLFIFQEIVYPRAKNGDLAVSFPINSSTVQITIRSVSGEFRGMETSAKLSKSVGIIPRSPGASQFNLTTEEKVEHSSRHFDVPPPHFFSTTLRDEPLKDNVMKIASSPNRYKRGKLDWLTSKPIPLPATTWPTTAVGFAKRHTRDTQTEQCEKFLITDDVKREFYSPNYPQNYPPKTNCIRTLEAEKGMLLKLDFRDRFELESITPVNDNVGECRFDYLEVRDGQYGFSNLLGIFCDKNFPPEIISKSRHLWLHFHSDDTIEYQGFKAVWSTVPRPTSGGVPPEQEPCIRNVTNHSEAIVGIDDVQEEKKIAEQYKVALDCLWIITAPADSRMQLTFDTFKLDKPNDCSANFLDVFDQQTDIPSRLKNFCGSIAEAVHTIKNTMYIRFYLEPKAINGSFKSLITVVRDKGSTDKPCRDNEYDCDDATCIALSLRCNNRFNCRFLRDEDASMCGTAEDQFDSSRVVIILVIFSIIMFGMCFAFVFNCIRKLMRDHRMIREHVRQSRENRLDKIGRTATPCPFSLSRNDLRDHGSESPSVEVDSSKELIPATLIAHEYTKELVLEMEYGTEEMNDIHQSNNVSNATQERLQESSEELEMCDSSCQTRESLFEPGIPDETLSLPAFSTFGYRSDLDTQKRVTPNRIVTPQSNKCRHHHRHQHHHPHPPPRQFSQHSHKSHPSNSPPSGHPVTEQCSVCMSLSSREESMVICPKHNPIPAPPGWSLHNPPYPHMESTDPRHHEDTGCMTYKKYPSPKSDKNPITMRNHYEQQSPAYTRQNTIGTRERYDSLICGSGRASSNTASHTTTTSNMNVSVSKHSTTPEYVQPDPRYRAEAVIEIDHKRPFSMESTKSAPDVIATH